MKVKEIAKRMKRVYSNIDAVRKELNEAIDVFGQVGDSIEANGIEIEDYEIMGMMSRELTQLSDKISRYSPRVLRFEDELKKIFDYDHKYCEVCTVPYKNSEIQLNPETGQNCCPDCT